MLRQEDTAMLNQTAPRAAQDVRQTTPTERTSPIPRALGLRYGAADVYARADTHAKVILRLTSGDPFTVHGTEGEFYQVLLRDGVVGFVYAQNVTGTDMPLTAIEQQLADDRAALAARPPGGWRGWVRRLGG
jgi:hypothetical protein